MSWLSRVCTVFLAPGLAAVVLPSTASAQQTDTFPSGAAVTFKEGRRQLIRKEMGGDFVAGTEEETRRYFNMAHCVCSAEKPGLFSSRFAFELTMTNGQIGDETQGEIWVGEPGAANACDTVDNQMETRDVCRATGQDIDDLDDELVGKERVVELPTHQLIKIANESCEERTVGSTVWVLANGMGGTGGTLDYGSSYTYDIDTKAPPIPDDIKVSAVEGKIDISWDIDVGDSNDIEAFQALCLTSDNKPVLSEAKFERDFDTPATLCQSTAQPLVPTGVTAAGSNGPEVDGTFPADLFTNNKYICAEGARAGALQISGLQNDTEYKVVIVSVDDSGNARAVYLDKAQVPIPATDAWEDLVNGGSEVEGGFCLIAKTYGDGGGPTQALRSFRDETLASTAFGRWLIAAYYDHTAGLGQIVAESAVARLIAFVVLLPVVAFALAWHLLTLPGLVALLALGWAWRRRRRPHRSHRLLIASAATAALVAVPALASAQSSIAPYWEDELIGNEGEEAGDPVRWNVGIKVGPYTPGIDAQFQDQTDSSRKPFDEAFRGGMWLPVLEVDYFFLNHIGQLGVGVSAGFSGDGARPWKVFDPEYPTLEDGSNPTTPGHPNRLREASDDMTFRMVPLTLTAVYRATQLHDLYGIPVVPYARGGLAYYLWWMRSPNGEIAELASCAGKLESTKCKGRGGSLGLVGSVGLAVRAEGIDKDAALSMRESGIYHTGFFIEGSLGWVDGFGNEKRLALGDVTWFGGFNFEF
jgi:hypothetical protein